jgi:hypothetical protein
MRFRIWAIELSRKMRIPIASGVFGICIVKHQEMTPKTVDDAVIQLYRASKSVHGDYDGWECQLIVDAKPPHRNFWRNWFGT